MDPRADQLNKIVPPHPLPFVSRKALRRCRDALPPPTECRYCGGKVVIRNHAEVYGREFGEWPYVYVCLGCWSYVGLHPKTDLPLGTLADTKLRNARKQHKNKFERLRKDRGWTRVEAYAWLAEAMGIDPEVCHWGMFEAEDCAKAGILCEEAWKQVDSEKQCRRRKTA